MILLDAIGAHREIDRVDDDQYEDKRQKYYGIRNTI